MINPSDIAPPPKIIILKKRIIKIGTCPTMILKFEAKENKIDNPGREIQI